MNAQEYFTKLEKHDWYYPFSDDFNVYRRGEQEQAELESLKENNPIFDQMYSAFVAHYSSGSSFGTQQTPKPKLEDFIHETV